MKVIAYIRFGNDPTTLPVACDEYETAKHFKDYIHFKGVTTLSDNVFPDFKISELVIPASKVMYILNGEMSEKELQPEEDQIIPTNEEDQLDKIWGDQ